MQIDQGLSLIKNKTNLSYTDIKQILGDGWSVTSQVYNILYSHSTNFPLGYSIDDILTLLQSYSFNISKTNLVRYLTPLSKNPFNLLITERSNSGYNSQIKRFILYNQNNQELTSIKEFENTKEKQIEESFKIIEKITGHNKNEIKLLLHEKWSKKLRVFFIIYENIPNYPSGFTSDEILNILEQNNMKFDRRKLPVYLKPFEATLKLMKFTRGTNNKIINIKLTIN